MDDRHSIERPDASSSKGQSPASLSRRALLKGGAKAMPVVLTLQSGAALAQSSNLISEASPYTRDLDGNTLCLDTGSVYQLPNGKYDFGQPADGIVNVIGNRQFYQDKNRSSPVETHDMCYQGGSCWFQEGGWYEVNLPANGVVLSATALVSISARGDILFNRIG